MELAFYWSNQLEWEGNMDITVLLVVITYVLVVFAYRYWDKLGSKEGKIYTIVVTFIFTSYLIYLLSQR